MLSYALEDAKLTYRDISTLYVFPKPYKILHSALKLFEFQMIFFKAKSFDFIAYNKKWGGGLVLETYKKKLYINKIRSSIFKFKIKFTIIRISPNGKI